MTPNETDAVMDEIRRNRARAARMRATLARLKAVQDEETLAEGDDPTPIERLRWLEKEALIASQERMAMAADLDVAMGHIAFLSDALRVAVDALAGPGADPDDWWRNGEPNPYADPSDN